MGGVLLSGVGMLGVLAAQVLKAGISRQREFLADALAVQITRDRDGLGCALRRIAGERPAALKSDYAGMISHFLLVQPAGLSDWFDTHPPLPERIARLYGRHMAPLEPATRTAAGEAGRAPGDAGAAGCAPCGDASATRGESPLADTIPFVRAALPLAAPVPSGAPGGRTDASAPGTMQQPENAAATATALITQIRSASLGFEMAGRWLVAIVARPRGRRARRDAARIAGLAGLAGRRVVARALARTAAGAGPALEQRQAPRAARALSARDRGRWPRPLGRMDLLHAGAPPAVAERVDDGARLRRAPSSKQSQSRALAALFAMAAAVGEASARATRDALAGAAAMLEIPPPASTPDEVGTTELALALDTLLGLPPLDKPILLKVLFTLARTPGDPNYDAFAPWPRPSIARAARRRAAARREAPEPVAVA